MEAPCALVTGGTGGLGSAIVRQLAAEGYPLALSYRSNAVAADALVEELTAAKVPVRAWRLDLTDAEACAGVVTEAEEQHGGIGVLVHAAGPHIPMVHLSRVAPATYAAALRRCGTRRWHSSPSRTRAFLPCAAHRETWWP